MKNINSISKRVMITLFVLLLSVVGTKNTFAQNQVAILQHNDTLSAFYGPDALSAAHTAASDGDIITLSSGNFNGCTLSCLTLKKVDTIVNKNGENQKETEEIQSRRKNGDGEASLSRRRKSK